jgi:hypothetical protein
MPSRRLHTIASGSVLNLLLTKGWRQEKEKLLVMLSSKITPFLSSNQGKTRYFISKKVYPKSICSKELRFIGIKYLNCFKINFCDQ